VSSTPFDVYVFDFDGTLVDSAAAKRRAFYEVFPADCAPAVTAVLVRDPDGSRHLVIPAMIAEAGRLGAESSGLDAAALVAAYGRAVERAVAAAPAMPCAEKVLEKASAAAAYVASMTPHDDLQQLLAQRGWLKYLKGAYGYPHAKPQVVARLLRHHQVDAGRLMVVGDGRSDREAAERNGCAFHAITDLRSIMRVPGLEIEDHV
jgi:phosphoglycolate phosphatase-like HAD superfamily hydrolase